MHLFATCKCLTRSTTNDFHSFILQTSYGSVKAPQKEISIPCLRFRPRLIARANDMREELVELVNSQPWNVNDHLSNEAPSSLRSSNGIRYSAVPEHTQAGCQQVNLTENNKPELGLVVDAALEEDYGLLKEKMEEDRRMQQAKLTESNKQELGLVVDAALEEDYGLLKEKIEEDRRMQLADKQDSDAESTAETVKSLKRSKVIAKQVISQSSARLIGFVSQLWVSAKLFQAVALEVRPSLLSGEIDRIFLADVCQIGDVVLINDESALENEMTAVDCETLVGYDVVVEDGSYIGKIRDYNFNLQDGKLMSLDFDAVGFSIVPSSLISTYRLDGEEVREVLTDTILVKAGAESRIRRLTKGFWQLPNAGQKRSRMVARSRMRSRRFPEISDFSRQARPLPSSTRRQIFEGGHSGVRRELPDSGPLPEDYDWPPQSRVR